MGKDKNNNGGGLHSQPRPAKGKCAGCHQEHEQDLVYNESDGLLYHPDCRSELIRHEEPPKKRSKKKLTALVTGAGLIVGGLVYGLTGQKEYQQPVPQVQVAQSPSVTIDFVGEYSSLEAAIHPVTVGQNGAIAIGESVYSFIDNNQQIAFDIDNNQQIELDNGLYVVKGTVNKSIPFQKPFKIENNERLESKLILPTRNIEGFMPVSYTTSEGEEKLVHFAETELTFGQWNDYIEHLNNKFVDKVVIKHGKTSYKQLEKKHKLALAHWMKKEISRRIPADEEGRFYLEVKLDMNTGYINLNPNPKVCKLNGLPVDEKSLDQLAVRGLSQGKLRDYVTMSTDVFGIRSPIAQYAHNNKVGQVRMATPEEWRVVATDNGLVAIPHDTSLYGPKGMGPQGMSDEFLAREWEVLGGKGGTQVRVARYEQGKLKIMETSHTPDGQDMPYGARLVIVPRNTK